MSFDAAEQIDYVIGGETELKRKLELFLDKLSVADCCIEDISSKLDAIEKHDDKK